MRRFWAYGVLSLVAAFFGFQLYQAWANEQALNTQYEKVQNQTEALINENNDLSEQIQYYSNPYNLEKKLRSETNYRLPNEQLIITTPSSTTATQ